MQMLLLRRLSSASIHWVNLREAGMQSRVTGTKNKGAPLSVSYDEDRDLSR